MPVQPGQHLTFFAALDAPVSSNGGIWVYSVRFTSGRAGCCPSRLYSCFNFASNTEGRFSVECTILLAVSIFPECGAVLIGGSNVGSLVSTKTFGTRTTCACIDRSRCVLAQDLNPTFMGCLSSTPSKFDGGGHRVLGSSEASGSTNANPRAAAAEGTTSGYLMGVEPC